MLFHVDLIYKKNSAVLDLLKSFCGEGSFMELDCYPDTMLHGDKNVSSSQNGLPQFFKEIVLIEETDSFQFTENIYDSIRDKCADKVQCIILTENRTFYNVVQWIRKGAADVLLTASLTPKDLRNSILSAKAYMYSKMGVEHRTADDASNAERTAFSQQRIVIPKSTDWSSIENCSDFDMTLVMISFSFDGGKQIYDNSYTNMMYATAKEELIKLSQYFGGMLWFWNASSGGMVFHFGDHVSLAVTACIHLINRLVINYNEKIHNQEVPTFKIAIHTGTDNFRMNNVEDINSRIINYTSHLLTRYTPSNTVCISDTVFDRMSVRLRDFFTDDGEFEGHKVYKF